MADRAPTSVPPTEHRSAPTSAAASFYRGLAYGLVGGLASWALIALAITLVWLA